MTATIPSEAERRKFFNEETKVTGEYWGTIAFALFCVVACLSGSIAFAVVEDVVDTLVFTVFSGIFGLLALWTTLASVRKAKKQAVRQCLAVADKYSLPLTIWHADDLESQSNAGKVFLRFAGFVGDMQPQLIPAGIFVGSGGKTADACRRLTVHLWQPLSLPSAVEAEEAESAQAKPA